MRWYSTHVLQIILQQRYNKSVDWYALGVLIFEMLSGLPPYHQTETNHMVLYERITRGPSFIRFPVAFNENATDIIMKLMEGDPSRRYGNLRHGAGDVFAHPWFGEVDWDRLAARQITAPYLPRINGEGDASAWVAHGFLHLDCYLFDPRSFFCAATITIPKIMLPHCMVHQGLTLLGFTFPILTTRAPRSNSTENWEFSIKLVGYVVLPHHLRDVCHCKCTTVCREKHSSHVYVVFPVPFIPSIFWSLDTINDHCFLCCVFYFCNNNITGWSRVYELNFMPERVWLLQTKRIRNHAFW